jgi:hypothetical protein
MPVGVWRAMMEMYYPNTGWMRVDSDVIRAVADYRSRHGLTSWEETLTRLLETHREVTS